MQRITGNHLSLLEEKGSQDLCLSIYISTSQPEDQTRPAHRLGELSQESRERLAERANLSADDIDAFLKPVETLARNDDFWHHPSRGLAIYLSREFFVPFKLPYEVAEMAILSNRFYLKPLLAGLTRNSQYYILSLSEKASRLFRADRFGAEEINVIDMPPPLADIKSRPAEAGSPDPARPGPDTALAASLSAFGSQDDAPSVENGWLHEYASLTNKSVSRTLNGRSEPLIVAAEADLFNAYRNVNTYPTLLDVFIAGEPRDKTPEELQRESWELIEVQCDAEEERAKKTIEAAVSLSGLATVDIDSAIEASIQGRIETCIIPNDTSLWGNFADDSRTSVAVRSDDDESLCFDLYDYLAAKTIESGGKVIFASSKDIPGDAKVAALLKY